MPEDAGPRQGIFRATALMTAGTALSRVTGLLRVVAMTSALGVTGTRLADTYNLANTTPNILFELFLGGVFTSVFVPVLVDLRARRDRGDDGDPSPLVSTSLLALAVVSAVAAVAAPLIMRIYTFRIPDPVARAQVHELATFLLRWFSPQIFFYGLSAIAEAILNTRRRFGPPKFAPVLNNLVVAGTLVAFAVVFGTQGLDLTTPAKTLLGAGTTAGVVLQAVVLVPLLRGEGLRFRPSLSDPAVRRVLRLAGYVVGYVVVNQVGLWVVLALATRDTGGVTAYQVAFMFLQLPHGLFAVSLITALLPDLSEASSAGDREAYRHRFQQGIRGVAYLLLPAAVGYVILAGPITRVLIARGVAGIEDAALVADVLGAFSVGLVSFSTFQLLTRSFYALQDTRTATALNAVAVGLHTAVNFPLFAWLGVRGLAFGHAIAYTVGALLLLWALSRRLDGLGLRRLVSPLARIALGTAIMGAVVRALRGVAPFGDLGALAVPVAAGAILYVAFSQVAGLEEREILIGWLRRRPTTHEHEE